MEEKGLVWKGEGWIFVNGIVEFETATHCLTESDLLLPVEDGEAVWITVSKVGELEEEKE